MEYNGDVFPCDYFVEGNWNLGNINNDTFDAISRRRTRMDFAKKKSIPHPDCDACEYETLCFRGCPHTRRARTGTFSDLDYFCESYKMAFAKSVRPLEAEVRKILAGAR